MSGDQFFPRSLLSCMQTAVGCVFHSSSCGGGGGGGVIDLPSSVLWWEWIQSAYPQMTKH